MTGRITSTSPLAKTIGLATTNPYGDAYDTTTDTTTYTGGDPTIPGLNPLANSNISAQATIDDYTAARIEEDMSSYPQFASTQETVPLPAAPVSAAASAAAGTDRATTWVATNRTTQPTPASPDTPAACGTYSDKRCCNFAR